MPTRNPHEIARLKAREEALAASAVNTAETTAIQTIDAVAFAAMSANIDALSGAFGALTGSLVEVQRRLDAIEHAMEHKEVQA